MIFLEYFKIEKRRKINKQLGNVVRNYHLERLAKKKRYDREREKERNRKRSVKFPGYLIRRISSSSFENKTN